MAEKKEPKVTKGNIKNGTIELVLLLLLRSEKKYGYQLANELLEYSEGGYKLNEATMYPTLYRLNEKGYLEYEQIKVGVKRTRVYDSITESGLEYLDRLLDEYYSITGAIGKIITRTSNEK